MAVNKLWTRLACFDMQRGVKETKGHAYLKQWFKDRPWLVKSHEADRMGMSKQQLDHILSGRRKPTLSQALGIYRHTGCEIYLWN